MERISGLKETTFIADVGGGSDMGRRNQDLRRTYYRTLTPSKIGA